MKPMKALIATIVGASLAAAGCSSPNSRTDLPARDPGRLDTGTPAAQTIAMEREIRYYVDEKGVVWDDRGRKHEAGQ